MSKGMVFGTAGLFIVITSLICASVFFAPTTSYSAPTDLTGTWKCEFGGTYYIRQIDNFIWWYGEANPATPEWSNVAYGTLKGTAIELKWADVPKGSAQSAGTLSVTVISLNRLEAKKQTGDFGSSVWTRQVNH